MLSRSHSQEMRLIIVIQPPYLIHAAVFSTCRNIYTERMKTVQQMSPLLPPESAVCELGVVKAAQIIIKGRACHFVINWNRTENNAMLVALFSISWYQYDFAICGTLQLWKGSNSLGMLNFINKSRLSYCALHFSNKCLNNFFPSNSRQNN